ncbi:hypothetical protein BDV36DRAFT_290843 [Aspergillus pseudocaelatus]|uniref:Uncharacterized protein n=1 Tax=Aspergillus pseudocaelatus TaxID=1825620 RepID=A0ABQ6X2E8_9EURO|nr:hypothetical protein BDV36DRAFT_290843 [Aspergillus pseudocaelatus]
MRIGAAVVHNASLLVGREKDSIEALDGTLWWVSDAAEENEVAGRLTLGGPRLTASRQNHRFACHEGDRAHEPPWQITSLSTTLIQPAQANLHAIGKSN